MRTNQHLLLFMLPVLAFLLIKPLKAQQYMRINKSDGTVLEIPIANVQKVTFLLPAAIEQHPELVSQLLKLKAFPNPAKEYVVLEYSLHEEGIVMIEVYNLQGVHIESLNQGLLQPGDYNHRLITQQLAPGAYLCHVRQNNAFVTQKIIVKR